MVFFWYLALAGLLKAEPFMAQSRRQKSRLLRAPLCLVTAFICFVVVNVKRVRNGQELPVRIPYSPLVEMLPRLIQILGL